MECLSQLKVLERYIWTGGHKSETISLFDTCSLTFLKEIVRLTLIVRLSHYVAPPHLRPQNHKLRKYLSLKLYS